MDNPGFHTRRKAAQQEESALPPSRGPDGHFRPVALLEPLDDGAIGGWVLSPSRPPSPRPTQLDDGKNGNVELEISAPPPSLSPYLRQTGYPFVRQSAALDSPVHEVPPSFDESPLSHLKPVERSERLNLKKKLMDPYLQFMCGPLLRYDTIDEHGGWHGAALIVTADEGSTYDPYPILKYRWDSKSRASPHRQNSVRSIRDVDLGPHPADPMAQHNRKKENDEHLEGPNIVEKQVFGTELYVYSGRSGTYTFWRFLIRVPLSDSEMKVQYSINDGLTMDFFVPGRRQTMRLAAYSCNGFSDGVNPDDFRGPGFQSGYDPLWVDLLAKHLEQPFHLLVGGGDQLYCDGVALEPELQEWIRQPNRKEKMHYPLTQEMLDAIDRFYFNHYCQSFRNGAFARANSSIPMLNMLDDHDLIDGYGSYPDELQKAPVFNTIGSRGYFFYLLFQCFINVSKDGINDRHHPIKSTIIGAEGPYIPYPSHSFLAPIGPTAWLLMLDCRAERSLERVCSEEQYARVFKRMNAALRLGVDHLIVQLGIPIAYPRMTFLETALSTRLNPLVALSKTETFGLRGFRNNFNGDAELLDDLNDQWTSKHHMAERNAFIERLQHYAMNRRVRISFLTGDAHSAAAGIFKTMKKDWDWRSSELAPILDHRYMLSIVSSAIVNTPPPHYALTMVHTLSKWRHRTMHHADTDEEMLPLFERDTDGSKPKSHYIMGRRNWCCITLQQPSGGLLFDIRVEKEKGHGETVGYCVLAPPPRWVAKPTA